MKLWEILNENNINKYVRMRNRMDFDYEARREYYVISKNGKGRIGIFACDGYQDDFLPSDMIEMEFEFIEKKNIENKYKKGEKVKTNWYVKRNKDEIMGGIPVSQKHYDIASDKENRNMTIKDMAEGWLYEPIYLVEENELIWSESMLDILVS